MDIARTGVSAIAEYEYTAKEPDELSLIKGAIILNVKEQPGGWWEGTLNGKTGVFPDSFVRLINNHEDKNSTVVLRDKSATTNRRCKVVYSYTQNNEDELSLSVGEVIEFLGEVEEGWWKGKLGNKIGVFPSNFVVTIEKLSPVLANKRGASNAAQTKKNLSNSRENLVSSISPNLITSSLTDTNRDAPMLPPKPVRELCKALFPYDPVNEDELELAEGDLVTILSKDLPDKGWWKGELKGKIGVFPDNFVSILNFDESPSKEKPDRPLSNKILSSKSPNNSVTNSHRKDSFGSKDSLNDFGIIVGNVAAHRLSLETRTVSGANDIAVGGVVGVAATDKPPRKGLETKANSDIRKSLENLDDRKSTPPPVLFKKPVVPIKKSPTVSSVTGNILGGLKQKVKSADHKSYSHDSFDGIGSSKMGQPQVADTIEKGIIGEKIRKEDVDFDHVERGSSLLQDMRASRAKAPKRRPPTGNTVNDNSSNITTIHNGGGGESQTDDDVAKPKPREWEKHKAPWMEELKASQAKKTSPNDTKSPEMSNASGDAVSDMSKSFSSSYVASHRKSTETSSTFETRANSVEVKSSNFETTQKKEVEASSMTKSMSSIGTKITIAENPANLIEDTKSRPVSVSLRNRSISPINRPTKSMHVSPEPVKIMPTSDTIKFTNTNNSINNTNDTILITQDNVCLHVTDIELRVRKLEKIVHTQNSTIEELIRSLKDEKDRVKILKTELEKYAQCVTQV